MKAGNKMMSYALNNFMKSNISKWESTEQTFNFCFDLKGKRNVGIRWFCIMQKTFYKQTLRKPFFFQVSF